MSALSGVVRLDGSGAAPAELDVMVRAMPHRVDGETGLWIDGAAGLAAGLRPNTPESVGETQPYHDRESGNRIVFDGRLDYRDELARTLRSGPEARTWTDARYVAAAYRRWGAECLAHLYGDFACAVWDQRAQRLVCLRDPMGGRLLYWTHVPGRFFAFASEVKALLALPGVPRRINEALVADYLCGTHRDGEHTLFADIHALRAGDVVEVRSAGTGDVVARRPVYRVQPAQGVPASAPDEDYAAGFRDVFEAAVASRLRSVSPVGSEFSGGLDSSYVTYVARRMLKQAGREPLTAYSMLFPAGSPADERAFIDLAAQEPGMELRGIEVAPLSPVASLEEMYEVVDDGVAYGNFHYRWTILKTAAAAGLHVVLNGVDGDKTVGHGAGRLRELIARDEWGAFKEEVRLLAERHAAAETKQHLQELFSSPRETAQVYVDGYLESLLNQGRRLEFARVLGTAARQLGWSRRRMLRRHLRQLLLPAPLGAMGQRAGSGVPGWVDPALARRVHLADRMQAYEARAAAIRSAPSREGQCLSFRRDAEEGVGTLGLNRDAALGVEAREPFMDRRVVEYCLALPSNQSLKQGWPRYVMRRAMEPEVPRQIAWRTGKASMRSTYDEALLRHDVARLEAHVLGSALAPYVRRDALRQRLDAGRHAPSALRDMARLAALSVLIQKWGPS